MVDVEGLLRNRLAAAFESVAGEPVDPAVRRSQHADYQADAAITVARGLGGGPREVAARVVAAARLGDLCSAVQISGPDFINLTIANAVLGQLLAELCADRRLGVASVSNPETVVVDYSAPNAAKEMHVGHLRSTIIGDAAVRLLEWQGHHVIRQNHIGEWGTPFGMLIEHLLDVGEAAAAHELSAGDLTDFYRSARQKFDTDEAFQGRARRRVVALQSGDPTTRRLWAALVDESKKYFGVVYSLLGVRLTDDDYAGESDYNDQLDSVVEELNTLGLLRDSDGARCVFPAGYPNREGKPLPLIVQKSDGGFGYAATDLATIRHRVRVLRAGRLVYVVGLPQRDHLGMVFQTARAAGWLTGSVRVEHIGHGSVLGVDGKTLRSRAGASVKLVDLLDEAVRRAAEIVERKNPDLDPTRQAAVARAVGIGAVKYADLATDRAKDYSFELDRMVSFEGNTAPYLQYARARICSIYRRAGTAPVARPEPVLLVEPAERVLAIELLGFGPLVEGLADSLEFHRLAQYLFGLASAFTAFYERCPVLKADPDVRSSRLVLCDLTARVLEAGLGLLGIDSPDQM